LGEGAPVRNLLVAFPKTGASWFSLSLAALGVDILPFHASNGHGRNLPFQPLEDKQIERAGRLVALFRDPRDTVVSGYWQCHARTHQFRGTLREFLLHPWHGIEKQVAFDFALMELSGRIPSRSVTYDAMHADGAGLLRTLAGFLGRPTSGERAQAVFEACRIDRLRALELAGEFAGRDTNKRPIKPKPGEPNTLRFRRGIVGSHRDEMSAEDIATCDEILAKHDYFARLSQHLQGQSVDVRGP